MLRLFQVVESEKTAKWQYTKHCQELTVEIKKLREEVSKVSSICVTLKLHDFKCLSIYTFFQLR